MIRKSYWVDSELNPKYLETGNMCDYTGLYYVAVAEISEDGSEQISRIHKVGLGLSSRDRAYELAGLANRGVRINAVS